MYWDASDLYRQTIWEKLPIDNFEWDENTQKSDAKFENNYDENSSMDTYLNQMLNILTNY